MAEYFLGIDYGTGGAKGCIMDGDGEIKSYHFIEYSILSTKPGWSEHDPFKYWEAACNIIKKCLTLANIKASEIKGIAISSALPSMVMLNNEGDPINNAYNLMDRRALEEVKWIKKNIGGQNYFKVSGNRLDDHPSIANLMWEKINRPEDFKNIYKVMTIEGYINYKLTGKYTLTHQSATFIGGYDLVKKEWNSDILKKIKVDNDLFPDLYFSKIIIGEVTKKAAYETGLVSGIPVSAGQVDFNASCIASGVIDEGDIQCNLGSCGNFGVVHNDINFIYEMIGFIFTVGEEDTYITVPTTTTGGMSLRFVRDKFSHLEVAMENSFNINSYDVLNTQAQGIKPGSEGLIVLPFLNGERTPIWDSYARGVVFGLSLHHNKGHWIKAIMEGVAYAMYDSFKILKESGKKINYPIIMHEGGAKSNLWRQIITDIFNIPTVLTEERAGAPYGDAYLAAVTTGHFKDFRRSKERVKYIEEMEPNEKNHNIYMEYFNLYKKIYENLRNEFVTLADLRNSP